MDPSREGGLLAWQFENYPKGHRNRRNLALHAATAPLFIAGTCAVVLAPFASTWFLAFAVPAVVLPLVVQGRGHRLEANPPSPFQGPGDFAARLFVEQWVTFPRYVSSGGFARAWREAGAGSPLERSQVTSSAPPASASPAVESAQRRTVIVPAVKVRAVPVPDGGLAAATFPNVDYADAYAVGLPPGVTARTFTDAVFASSPRWVTALLALRNALVRPLGLIATRSPLERAAAPDDGGARIGIFPVLAEAGDEVLLGLDDRHLDFRLSVRVVDDGRERLGVVATLVRFHGLLGRAYFVPVRPAHRLIVPAMLRHRARSLAAARPVHADAG